MVVLNQDRTAVPVGADFVMAVLQADQRFGHLTTPVNTVGNATYPENPLTNGERGSVISATQN